MANVRKSTGNAGKIVKSSGQKERGPAIETHGASRIEPSKVTRKNREVREQKERQGR